jgi:hypothetical protein
LSVKFFLDLSEYASKGIDTNKFSTKIYYSAANAQISSVKPWDKENNIYYVEISFPNDKLYAKTYVQFAIYNYEDKVWDSSNDFSTSGVTDTFKENKNISVYKNNVKVYGADPSGEEETLLGDVNSDGIIDALDLSLLKVYMLTMDGSVISVKNADINQDGFVDAIDFAGLKKLLLK